MPAGDMARLYHELSSYEPEREWTTPVEHPLIRTGFEPNDVATFPAPCKSYPPGLPTLELPRSWPPGGGSASAVLAGEEPPAAAPDLTALARLLHLSAGVVRVSVRSDGRRYLFRSAGSAGGAFPLELYVAARGVDGLADGVHWFDPLHHALVAVGPAAAGGATTLVLTGVPWRTGWRYAERGFRHLYWDAGTMLSHVLAVAQDAGLAPRPRTTFPDDAVARLVGADGVDEFPLAIVTFGDGEPAIRAGGEAARGAVDRREAVEFPLVTRVQHAGDGERLGAPRAAGAPLEDRPPRSPPLDDVILRRSSTRLMDPARRVDRGVLEWTVAAALRGSALRRVFVAALRVAGLEAGLYRWPSLAEPVRAGDLREELFRICLDQEQPRDAAFVVVSAADLAELDDRGYREALLEAGIVDGRVHLGAFALGLGATGMTFLDSEVPGLLGEPLAALLFTCVGAPAYRHRPGGPPGEPVLMRPLRRASG